MKLCASLRGHLKDGEYLEAAKIARQCHRRLKRNAASLDDVSKTMLLAILAEYAGNLKKRKYHEIIWLASLNLDQFMIPNPANRMIKTMAARVWTELGVTLAEVERIRFGAVPPTGLKRPRPVNFDPNLKTLRIKLKNWRKKLAAIIPEKDWPKFGIK